MSTATFFYMSRPGGVGQWQHHRSNHAEETYRGNVSRFKPKWCKQTKSDQVYESLQSDEHQKTLKDARSKYRMAQLEEWQRANKAIDGGSSREMMKVYEEKDFYPEEEDENNYYDDDRDDYKEEIYEDVDERDRNPWGHKQEDGWNPGDKWGDC
jgi:3-mercaptopyruvate sulfurtransferase SseA